MCKIFWTQNTELHRPVKKAIRNHTHVPACPLLKKYLPTLLPWWFSMAIAVIDSFRLPLATGLLHNFTRLYVHTYNHFCHLNVLTAYYAPCSTRDIRSGLVYLRMSTHSNIVAKLQTLLYSIYHCYAILETDAQGQAASEDNVPFLQLMLLQLSGVCSTSEQWQWIAYS